MYRQNFTCTVMASFFLRLAGKCIIRQVKREKKGIDPERQGKRKKMYLCGRNRLVFVCVCVVVPCGRLLNTVVKDGQRHLTLQIYLALYRIFFKTEGVHAVVWILAHQWGFSLLVKLRKSETVGLKVLLVTKGKIWVFWGRNVVCHVEVWKGFSWESRRGSC